MTSQKLTPNYDNADEASSLLTIATASPAPSFSLRPDGVATTKKNGVPTMRAMIATACFLLGTLAVLYSGGRGSNRHNNTHLTGGISAALVLGQNQAASVYDPCKPALYAPATDICFADKDNAGKYCWYTDDHSLPYGNWKVDGKHGNNNCGEQCIYAYAPTQDKQIQDCCTFAPGTPTCNDYFHRPH